MSINVNGTTRTYRLYVPNGCKTGAPLVIAMHGAGGSSDNQCPHFNEIADTVAEIPDAVKRETYIDFLSRKFGIRREALEERVSATRAKTITAERNRSKTNVYSLLVSTSSRSQHLPVRQSL